MRFSKLLGLQLPGDKVRFRESVRTIIYEDLSPGQQNSYTKSYHDIKKNRPA